MTRDVEDELDTTIAAVKAAHPGRAWTGGELAPELPAHLRGPFWNRMIGRYLAEELAKTEEVR